MLVTFFTKFHLLLFTWQQWLSGNLSCWGRDCSNSSKFFSASW